MICAVGIVLWAVWPDVEVKAPVAAKQPAGPAEVAASETGAGNRSDRAACDRAAGVACERGRLPRLRVAHPPLRPPATVAGGRCRTTTTAPVESPATATTVCKFAFTDDCWVEIKDAQGSSIYSDLSKSGDALELVGRPPFHILLGNAPAVTLAFNGERVALSPHTRNNVGTLVLGQ